jgi:uncharacterized protein
MAAMTQSVPAVADRLMSAIEANDAAAATACYTPDARIWHNFDGIEQTVAENVATLGWLAKRLSNRKYEILARHLFAGGYVQQHVLTGTLNDGTPFRMPACVIVHLRDDGLVSRLEEYLDTGHTKALRL